MGEKIEVFFDKEKETKNTVRFQEAENEQGEPPLIGTLYVQKWALKRLGDPERIRVALVADIGGDSVRG